MAKSSIWLPECADAKVMQCRRHVQSSVAGQEPCLRMAGAVQCAQERSLSSMISPAPGPALMVPCTLLSWRGLRHSRWQAAALAAAAGA